MKHALRAILQAGGNIRSSWDLEEALKVGDRATHTRVLEKLYEEMRDKPVRVDLDALWTDLGVHLDGESVRIDESARLAAIRRAITGELRPAAACAGSPLKNKVHVSGGDIETKITKWRLNCSTN